MTSPPPVGVLLATTTAPERIAPLAAQAERSGFAQVWVAEDYFFYSGFSSAALALAATTEVTVGLGIVSAVARHPAVTAMEVATLARAHPGRFQVGIGHGLPAWVAQMGLTPRSPLRALEECVCGVRRLLDGETVDGAGAEFRFESISLTHPPTAPVPLLTGVLGPRSLELSGRIADGTVVSVLAGTAYLGEVRQQVGRAAGDYLLPTFALFSIDRDGAAARAAVRPMLAFYLAALGAPNPLTEPYGYNTALADMLDRGGADLVAKEMPDAWIDELAVAGDPDDVAGRIAALGAAGATSVVLSPVDADHADAQLATFADTVLRNL